MTKYKSKSGIEFENNDVQNDVAPILIGIDDSNNEVDINELKNKYKDEKIYTYKGNVWNEDKHELEQVTYYYIAGIAIDAKKYKLIENYEYDYSDKADRIIEVVMQAEKYKRVFYKHYNKTNCSYLDLVDIVVDDLIEEYYTAQAEEDGYATLDLFDEGGWSVNIEIDSEDDFKNYISSIRIVEEVQ